MQPQMTELIPGELNSCEPETSDTSIQHDVGIENLLILETTTDSDLLVSMCDSNFLEFTQYK